MPQPEKIEPPNPAGGLPALREIVAALRSPEGCPWDREQTHLSIRNALVEECYETIDAIESADDANLCEELGDLLLHVVMHSQMASERGAFSLDDVIRAINEKLIRRHPHVFADGSATSSEGVLKRWEEIKREERRERGGGHSAMEGIPRSLPAVMRAEKAQKKAARLGLDWPDLAGVLEKVREESGELARAQSDGSRDQIEAEAGDLLFSAVNAARFLKVEGELALNEATDRFIERVRRVEILAQAEGFTPEQLTPEKLDALWNAAKTEESSASAPQ